MTAVAAASRAAITAASEGTVRGGEGGRWAGGRCGRDAAAQHSRTGGASAPASSDRPRREGESVHRRFRQCDIDARPRRRSGERRGNRGPQRRSRLSDRTGHSAVDTEILAGDVARAVRGKEGDQVSLPPRRCAYRRIGIFARISSFDWKVVHEAGQHVVHADVLCRMLIGKDLGEGCEARRGRLRRSGMPDLARRRSCSRR